MTFILHAVLLPKPNICYKLRFTLLFLLTQTPLGLRAGAQEKAAFPNTVQSPASLVPCQPDSFPSPPPQPIFSQASRAPHSPSATASLFIPFASPQYVLHRDQDGEGATHPPQRLQAAQGSDALFFVLAQHRHKGKAWQ